MEKNKIIEDKSFYIRHIRQDGEDRYKIISKDINIFMLLLEGNVGYATKDQIVNILNYYKKREIKLSLETELWMAKK